MKTLDIYALRAYNNNINGDNVKRTDLIKLLSKNGWYLKRNGGDHDIYIDGKNNESIPRHQEIKENLAKNPAVAFVTAG